MEGQHHQPPQQGDHLHGWHMLPHEFVNDTFFDHKPAWHYRLEKDQLAPPENLSELTRNASVKSTSSHFSSDSGYSTVPPSSTADPCEQPGSPWSFDLFLADNPYDWQLPAASYGPDSRQVSTGIVPQPARKPTRERRSRTRVRTGCYNCATRRVKCQETKPACGHCIKRGIDCEYPRGPEITPQRNSNSKPIAPPIAIECIEPNGTVISAHSMDSGIEVDACDQFHQDWPEYGSQNAFLPGSPDRLLDHRAQNQQQDHQPMHEASIVNRVEGPSNGLAVLPLTVEDGTDNAQLPDPVAYQESMVELRGIMANANPPSSGESSLVSTRVPSPWQQAATLLISDQNRISEHLYRSLEWVLSKHDDDDEPTHDTDPEASGSTTPTHGPAPLPSTLYESAGSGKRRILDALSVQVPDDDRCQHSKRRKIAPVPMPNDESGQSDDPGSTSSHHDTDRRQPVSQNLSSSGQNASANSARRANNGPPGRGNEHEDAGNGPPRPPRQPLSPPYDSMRPSKRPRYACPYNKWDPIGCQLCCMPCRKNPEGGAEVFSRVKSHIFRNHDISIRCQRCWASFPSSKSETLEDHVRKKECMRKASPTKYWMNEEQRRQVRGQRFVGSGEENWYHLFRILLPDAPLQDEHGGYVLTPYYVPLAGSRTPSNLSGPASQTAGSGIPLPVSGTQTPNGLGLNQGSFLQHLSNTPQMRGELPAVTDDTWSHIPSYIYDTDVAVTDDPLVSITSHPNDDVGVSSIDLYPTPRTRRQSDESGESGSGHVFGRGRINSGSERQSAPQDPSSTFLKLDNERLKRNMQQVRGERDDLRRRMEAANSRVDCLEQLLEDALYEEGKSSKLCSKLFELSKTLVDLRKELG